MAPRKRTEKSIKNAEEQVAKRGRKKKINNLKSPTLITIEIPATTASETGTRNSKARVVTAKNLKTAPGSDTKKSKARVVTAQTLSKNDIKIMLANEVVQAHFSKQPIITEVEPTVKRKPGPKRLLNKCKDSSVPNKTKPVAISNVDSDGSAFEETPEQKPKKRGPKGLLRKKVECHNLPVIDTNKSTDDTAKRSYVTKKGLNKENTKSNKRPAQNCGLDAPAVSKPRKRMAIKKEISTKIWTRLLLAGYNVV